MIYNRYRSRNYKMSRYQKYEICDCKLMCDSLHKRKHDQKADVSIEIPECTSQIIDDELFNKVKNTDIRKRVFVAGNIIEQGG